MKKYIFFFRMPLVFCIQFMVFSVQVLFINYCNMLLNVPYAIRSISCTENFEEEITTGQLPPCHMNNFFPRRILATSSLTILRRR